jgi:hypothetical protein
MLNGKELKPARSLKLINHSPDGFFWGYSGSAPSQLAFAILLELLTVKLAYKYYMRLKWEVIFCLPQTDFDEEFDFEIPETIKKSLTNGK